MGSRVHDHHSAVRLAVAPPAWAIGSSASCCSSRSARQLHPAGNDRRGSKADPQPIGGRDAARGPRHFSRAVGDRRGHATCAERDGIRQEQMVGCRQRPGRVHRRLGHLQDAAAEVGPKPHVFLVRPDEIDPVSLRTVAGPAEAPVRNVVEGLVRPPQAPRSASRPSPRTGLCESPS